MRIIFSEPMSPGFTVSAITLAPMSNASTCGGTVGTSVSGSYRWPDPSILDIDPVLSSSACYQLNISTTARDAAGNAMAAAYTKYFKTGTAAPTVTLSGFLNGSLFYPGAAVTASSTSGWTASSSVAVLWEDGTTLATATAGVGGTLSLPFNIPTTA